MCRLKRSGAVKQTELPSISQHVISEKTSQRVAVPASVRSTVVRAIASAAVLAVGSLRRAAAVDASMDAASTSDTTRRLFSAAICDAGIVHMTIAASMRSQTTAGRDAARVVGWQAPVGSAIV